MMTKRAGVSGTTLRRVAVALALSGGLAAPAVAFPYGAVAMAPKDPAFAGRGGAELVQVQDTPAPALPNGASSLTETYGDWRVACSQQAEGRQCILSQTQSQQNGQRLLVAEFGGLVDGGGAVGLVVLPFGLAVQSPIALTVDEVALGEPLAIRTCLPVGCLLDLRLDDAGVAALRTGTQLRLDVVADGGGTAALGISLNGFGAGLDRVTELLR